MIIKSLVADKNELVPVEVEIAFLPGLPQIQFLGLPDQLIKESIFRMKSAFQSCGYEFPKTHQIVVNIRPVHFRKTSRGLELAVALGILQATGQIEIPTELREALVYGEIGLDGKVSAPDDLFVFGAWKKGLVDVVTGSTCQDLVECDFKMWRLRQLADLSFEETVPFKNAAKVQRPEYLLDKTFSEEQARLLEIASLGEHNVFLAGPSGVGKSTLAKTIWALRRSPNENELWNCRERNDKADMSWWPLIAPHHTVTTLAMAGGGAQVARGELARAHQGVLLMDEYLEFNPRVQEVLREPMEEGNLRIARAGRWEQFSTDFQVVATSNLCPCGKWTPKASPICRRTLSKCRSYREKISGPVLDRFQIFKVLQRSQLSGEGRTGLEILRKVEAIREVCEDMPLRTVRLSDLVLRKYETQRGYASFLSLNHLNPRRALQIRRLALTLAVLAGRSGVHAEDIEEARHWVQNDLEALEKA